MDKYLKFGELTIYANLFSVILVEEYADVIISRWKKDTTKVVKRKIYYNKVAEEKFSYYDFIDKPKNLISMLESLHETIKKLHENVTLIEKIENGAT